MRIPRTLSATTAICAIILLVGVGLPISQTRANQSSSTPPNYESLSRQIISNLVAKQYDKVSALYSPELAKDLPTQKLAASWESIITQLGPLQSVSSVEVEDAAGMHIAFTTCVFQRLTLTLRIGFNSQGQFATFSSIPPD